MIYGSDDSRRCVDFLQDYCKRLRSGSTLPIACRLMVISKGGHVPFTSVFEGLKYVFAQERKN